MKYLWPCAYKFVNRQSVFNLKKVLKIISVIILAVVAFFVIQNYPFGSDAKPLPRLTDTSHLRKCLNLVTNTSKPRTWDNTDILDTVACRIETEFRLYTNRVSVQRFKAGNNEYKNVIASFGPEGGSRIIIGAHYDVCGNQQGADDNASRVAGILELAGHLKDKPLKYRIDLVAYSLEDPPYFNTENMGSYVHAKSLYDNKVPVAGMISLEMIGYYSDEENLQEYPLGFLKWVYGNKGDFITIVRKSVSGDFANKYSKIAFDSNSISTKSFRAASFLGGIDLSDHRNYWHFGYSAIMITNTSFYRNHNYHTGNDQLYTLDISRMALVIDGIYRTITALN